MSPFQSAHPPRPFDPARAQRTFESLEGYTPDAAARAVLEAAFGNSPFLARLALREQAILSRLFAEGPEAIVAEARGLALSATEAAVETEAMARLRIAKRRAALAIALADIAGIWTLEQVTQALTGFAD